MLQELSPALRNSSRGSSKRVSETLKFAAIFAIAALTTIVLASSKIARPSDAQDAVSLYGP
jgi:hypothetical protein